jgi:hypothetical protein
MLEKHLHWMNMNLDIYLIPLASRALQQEPNEGTLTSPILPSLTPAKKRGRPPKRFIVTSHSVGFVTN